jgi:hypothetical protein
VKRWKSVRLYSLNGSDERRRSERGCLVREKLERLTVDAVVNGGYEPRKPSPLER